VFSISRNGLSVFNVEEQDKFFAVFQLLRIYTAVVVCLGY
jgi:hypothetical protein